MKVVNSLEEYKHLIGQINSKTKKPFTNIYLMSEGIERLISLKILFYEINDAGLVFYVDEEKYYRVYLYVNIDKEFSIGSQDKKLIFRYVFKNISYNEQERKRISEWLSEQGFIKEGTSVQIQGCPQTIYDNMRGVEKYAESLERKGYKCVFAERDMLPKVDSMIIESEILKDYHIEYRTENEKDNLPDGTYTCIVKGDEICAASICYYEKEVAHMDGIVVKDKYKVTGLAPILTFRRMEWLIEKGILLAEGWILTHNEKSLQYHSKVGYKQKNKYSDEWVKDGK